MTKARLGKLKFATAESLKEGRFSFIEDITLRTNVSIYAQYVSFLVTLDEEYDIGSLTYSIYKDIVIHTAQIIEGLIYYKLKKLIRQGLIEESQIVNHDEKYLDKKELHRFDENERLIACREKKEQKRLDSRTEFCALNRAGKKSGLLTTDLFKRCEEIREMRNKIHLSALANVDDQYTKRDINRIFKVATELVDRVRDYNG